MASQAHLARCLNNPAQVARDKLTLGPSFHPAFPVVFYNRQRLTVAWPNNRPSSSRR
jgi:hypothetical protein